MLRHLAASAMTVLVGLAVVACSSSAAPQQPASTQGGATTSATTSTALCASIRSLTVSMQKLVQVDVHSGAGVHQVEAQLAAVRSDLQRVADAAKQQYPSEVDAVQHDLASLQTAIETAKKTPTYPTVAQVGSEITTLVNSAKGLAGKAATNC